MAIPLLAGPRVRQKGHLEGQIEMLGSVLKEVPVALWIMILLLAILLHNLELFLDTQSPNPITLLYHFARKQIQSLMYLFSGADIIDREYFKANGNAFTIQTPGKKHTMVTSQRHIKELNEAPLDRLSLHAVAKDFLQPRYTMHGFEWKDQRGIEGVGFVRALRTLLTSRLPVLLPKLDAAIASELEAQIQAHKDQKGHCRMPIYTAAKKIVAMTNCLAFFGSNLAQDQQFTQVALQFPEDVSLAAEILRTAPGFIAPLLSSFLTQRYRSSKTMYDFLIPVVEERLRRKASVRQQSSDDTPSDGIQWLIDTSPKKQQWSSHRLVGEIMAIWYGSVHTLAIAATYAIMDLYTHEEYVKPLREEASAPGLVKFKESAEGLPLLDSFLRESARLSAFESTGVRRQALSPFTFSDGLHVSRGDWICVPHRSMMRDKKHFVNPLEFDAFRWVKESVTGTNVSENRSQLVDASDRWLVWGTSRILCPGRFYATAVLKLILTHLLLNYDCSLQDTQGPRYMQWRSAIIPKPSIGLFVRPRGP